MNKEKPASRTKKDKKSEMMSWTIKVVCIAFVISIVLSYVSNTVLAEINIFLALFILLLFIIINVVTDIIGVAVATADEKPFHSMSAKQVKGSKMALKLLKNADKVSNFCSDVIGDIAGVVSGSAGVVISAGMSENMSWNVSIVTLLMTAVIAALTIGGKAFGKSLALNKPNDIVYRFSSYISIFEKNPKR